MRESYFNRQCGFLDGEIRESQRTQRQLRVVIALFRGHEAKG
jgi:hypothetical protein